MFIFMVFINLRKLLELLQEMTSLNHKYQFMILDQLTLMLLVKPQMKLVITYALSIYDIRNS